MDRFSWLLPSDKLPNPVYWDRSGEIGRVGGLGKKGLK